MPESSRQGELRDMEFFSPSNREAARVRIGPHQLHPPMGRDPCSSLWRFKEARFHHVRFSVHDPSVAAEPLNRYLRPNTRRSASARWRHPAGGQPTTMLTLRVDTPPSWLQAVMQNFNAFLVDHASCERKASATALSLVSHYPDRSLLVETMIDLALEELEHYRSIYRILRDRGLQLGPDVRDPYVRGLTQYCRQGTDWYFLDRLLIGGIVEARGCERFGLVAAALPAGPLKSLYTDLTASEARHHGLFLRLARTYFPLHEVDERKAKLLDIEAQVIAQLPSRPALH